jgi:hypothetical protein
MQREPENRIADAVEILMGVYLDLDRRSHECESCGAQRAHDWGQFKQAQVIQSCIRKLDKLATEMVEAKP